MINTNKKLDAILKRIDKLNVSGLQLILEMITDINNDNVELYFCIKVLDRYNRVIQEDKITNTPKEYIEKYIDKYNLTPIMKVYRKENNKLINGN